MGKSWVTFSRYLFNTVFITFFGTFGHLIIASMGAFVLAKYEFPGNQLFFKIVTVAMMFTGYVTQIPNYLILNKLGWIDTYWAIIIPAFASPMGLFLMKQFMEGLPTSLIEAAKIDGANGWKTFWHITVPLLRPTIIMTFIMSINGTLQLFDESVNLTAGGPANSTITMSHYIYNSSFGTGVANFGYASAMSFFVFILVGILAFINLKVGDTRD
jgi:ABC-type glycerol-3-phosphate transport system permease component